MIWCFKENKSDTMNFEARCSAVIPALTGVFSRIFRLKSSDDQGNDSLPLFYYVFVSGPDAFITSIPVEMNSRQRVFTGQGYGLSLFGLYSLQRLCEFCWDG